MRTILFCYKYIEEGKMKKIATAISLALIVLVFNSCTSNKDWPMWRYDPGRSAASPHELPETLHLQWIRQYEPREPVWDDPLNQDLMSFDTVFEPIVLGQTLFIGFNDQDKVVAIDTRSGKEKWTFYCDGPVRLPMAAGQGRLYFTSDDGYLYCLSAKNGSLLFKLRGGPSDRKVLGNKRMISSWPARGGVVLKDGIVYYAASIWPFMGTFIYAIDAKTGDIIWENQGTHAQYIKQPHNSPAFAGVAPQGILTISGDKLLVPGGRSVPACFELETGKFVYYHLTDFNKTGGAFTCSDELYFFNHARDKETNLFITATGELVERYLGEYPVITPDYYCMSGDSVLIRDAEKPTTKVSSLPVDASGDLIKAGSTLYAGGNNQVTAIQLAPNGDLSVKWNIAIDGQVGRLLAADDRLFVVTLEGKILSFGKNKRKHNTFAPQPQAFQFPEKTLQRAKAILKQGNATTGYALLYQGDKELAALLALQSELNIVLIQDEMQTVSSSRKFIDDLGLSSERVHILAGSLSSLDLPPYFASVIVVGENQGAIDKDTAGNLVRLVRPYGGKLIIPPTEYNTQMFRSLQNPMLEIASDSVSTVISREGSLPGASNWTHLYGDMANTVKSDDKRVKLPLGLLWFGGNSNLDVLPRHGHGPPEQIVDGRLIIEGMDCISARDVYTGRVLWKHMLDSLATYGQYWDATYSNTPLVPTYNQEHLPGANVRGTNFVATHDYVYIVQGSRCKMLDIKTGMTEKILDLPKTLFETGPKPWTYIGISDQNLVAGAEFISFSALYPPDAEEKEKVDALSGKDLRKYKSFATYDLMASKTLLIMDRYTGDIKWQKQAKYGFIHNSLITDGKTLYCLDKLPPGVEKKLERRGKTLPTDYRLMAIDLESGKIVWQKGAPVFGSWLGYSEEYHCLLQATRPSRDMVVDERGERMVVHNATDGKVIWDRLIGYSNPPILHHQEIITDNAAYDLLTGEQKQFTNPLTGTTSRWTYSRNYGCNYNIASEHMLSFRSAAAGFYDLNNNGGTGNLGGFKSGCTSNLIAAGGVLNAPDYTRTCQCSYQNQTSLALIHMPELEYWTTNDLSWDGQPVRKVGLNLNAPGDRVADNGTLWLDFPSIGGESPDLPVKYDSLSTRGIRKNSLSMQKTGGQEWIVASGLCGPLKLDILLAGKPVPDASYTVRLYFAELEDKKPGERLFHVKIQGKTVLENFDIASQAGAPDRAIIREFNGIAIDQIAKIQCIPASDNSALPLLCGVEFEREI
ncbi:PQQ-binding-like beta-propeller repeat protein [candidate division KSB1 bacterium]|nr:PQQ-binding-like beta-propeller repeat protein [candidate division KSB1 bacterium]